MKTPLRDVKCVATHFPTLRSVFINLTSRFRLGGIKGLQYNIYLKGADEEKLIKKLNDLHRETETALQICLATQKFEIGKYEADEYSKDWKKVSD